MDCWERRLVDNPSGVCCRGDVACVSTAIWLGSHNVEDYACAMSCVELPRLLAMDVRILPLEIADSRHTRIRWLEQISRRAVATG